MSDMVATAFGSLCHDDISAGVSDRATMSTRQHTAPYSVIIIVTSRVRETSTNSVATIFAWTGALRKRGELDGNEALADFAGKLEKATLDTIESGKMTKDLALITSLKEVQVLNSKEFILAVKTKLDELMA